MSGIRSWANLGKILSGICPNGWHRYFISAHEDFHEADISEISELRYVSIADTDRRERIFAAFVSTISWLGNLDWCLLSSTEKPTDYDTDFYEVSIRRAAKQDCRRLVSDFLNEVELPMAYLSDRGFFVILNYDMTIIIVSPFEVNNFPLTECIYAYKV